MSREEDVLSAIDGLDGFSFQKFARRLLQRELYPALNPLPEQDDLGQDARTEELPITELPGIEDEPSRISFAISKTTTRSKLTSDCDKCRDNDFELDTIAFVTSGEVSNRQRTSWEEHVEEEYGWDLIIYDRTWFADIATKPQYEKLVDEVLQVPPPNGDYYGDIVEKFSEVTNDTLSRVKTSLPHSGYNIDRTETNEIISHLTDERGVLATGNAGVGKTGILGQVVERWENEYVLFIDARHFSEVTSANELRQAFDFNGSISDAVTRLGRQEGCLVVVDQLDNIGGTPAGGVFSNFISSVEGAEGVSILCASREWDLKNRREYEVLTESESFEIVEVSELPETAVREVLRRLGISEHSDELVSLGENLLNLSIIAELAEQVASSDINFEEIKSQIELWDRYQETLVERERRGGEWDRDSGYDVRARAVELAQRGLRDGSRVFPISLRQTWADTRLISRNVINHEIGERYSFRHDELQDYFYAWNAVNRLGWSTPYPVLEELDQRVAAGVFRWMLRILLTENVDATMEFVDECLKEDVLGYYTASNLVDEIRTWNPDDIDDDLLELTLDNISQRNELCRYFYNNLSNPGWVAVLHRQGRYDEPDGPLLGYLERVARDVPELVEDIVNSTTTEDEGTRAYFIRISERLPAEYISANLDRFQEWLPDAHVGMGPYNVHYSNLIETLLEKDVPEAALVLLDSLIEPQPPEPETIEHELESGDTFERKYQTEATGLADTYTIESAIENTHGALPEECYEQFVSILEENLISALELEAGESDVEVSELGWPLSIDGSDLPNTHLKEVLLDSLRTVLRDWVAEDTTANNRRDLLMRYLGNILILRRLGLYLLRLYADAYPDLVKDELYDNANFDSIEIQYEFFTLLRDGFEVLDDVGRREICEIIDNGPDRDEIWELVQDNSERFQDRSTEQIVDEKVDLWKLRRFWMLRDQLPGSYSDQLDQLVDQYGEPDHPETVISTQGGAVSFVGPMEIEELRELPPEEILALCASWNPEDEDDEHDFLTEVSQRGLAEDLKTLVEDAPNDFAPHLSRLVDADSVYIYHAFQGLSGALGDEQYFDWSPVIEVCEEAATRFDDWGSETRKKTCRLLKDGLTDSESGLLENHRTAVRGILISLSNDPDPGLEAGREVDFLPHDDPLHTAINAVRPVALNALITYAAEWAKQDGFEGSEEEQESGLEEDVKAVLRTRIEDPSSAVHSVFGQRIVTLRWLDHNFAQDHLELIFPLGEGVEPRERFSSAWAAYLAVNRWYSDIYEWLREYYFHAIDLHAEEGRFDGHNAGNGFVAHALCSYLLAEEPLGDEGSLLTHFYSHVSTEKAGSASWQLWRWGADNEEFREHWPKVQELWERRLDDAEEGDESHTREFQWFVEWLDLVGGETDPAEIESLLQSTISHISAERRCWNTLETYLAGAVSDDPLTCIRIYNQLLNQPHWPSYRDFDSDARIILETALEAGSAPRDVALEAAETIAEVDSEYLSLVEEYSIE
ncbi:hypothetical protein [Haladaptatus sp. T7]|uniref:hypothetical protein n=1 Tax=Haladaptatus sp. T7 TaxID=2029368 RepID=UPI0021A252FF|nr:hypothetical protein [Haladaptatus sp. T7]GKZ16223.1 hypothetical protein HAL_41040 [Haladaptatus sp. T7]